MGVFDELNKGVRRVEEPEARKTEKIQSKGETRNVNKKSSGVTFKTYQTSIKIAYWGVGLAVVAVVVFFGYKAISAFIGG